MQKDDINTAEERLLFDEIILQFPKMDPNMKYIHKNAQIAKSYHFENGSVKILDGKKSYLSVSERIVCNKLRKGDSVQEVPETDNTDFETGVLAKRKKVDMSSYQFVDCRFLAPTFNCPRAFLLKQGTLLTKHRENLSPLNFEEQLFLYANSELWSVDTVIDNLLNSFIFEMPGARNRLASKQQGPGIPCKYCSKKDGENWLQCENCDGWTHSSCMGYTKEFDFLGRAKNVHFFL